MAKGALFFFDFDFDFREVKLVRDNAKQK